MINQTNDLEWKYWIIKLNKLKRQFIHNAEQMQRDAEQLSCGETILTGIDGLKVRTRTENDPATIWRPNQS